LPKPKAIKDGVYYDMPPEQYYGSTALGSSKLKAFAESPLHYDKFHMEEDSDSLAFGRAAHMYILEGAEVFHKHYAIMPEKMIRRGKDYEIFIARNPGRDIITATNFKHILGMQSQLMKSEAAKYIEAEGSIEVSLFWTGKKNKIKCKGRLDKLIPRENIDLIVDYKTTASAEEYKCMRSMSDYKYWLQEAHYGTGYHQLTGRDCEFLFIFQEKTAPYDVCLVRMTDQSSPIAYQKHTELMAKLKCCLVNKEFPGRNTGIKEWNFYE
jgi:hypothetical protein